MFDKTRAVLERQSVAQGARDWHAELRGWSADAEIAREGDYAPGAGRNAFDLRDRRDIHAWTTTYGVATSIEHLGPAFVAVSGRFQG